MELSANQIQEQLHALLNPQTGEQTDGTYIPSYNWVRDVFVTGMYCVYQGDKGKLFSQKFAVNEITVTLEGQPSEVIVQYTPPSTDTKLEQPEPTNSPVVAKVKASEHLRAAMLEAATIGDAEQTAAIAALLKRKEKKPDEPPESAETQAAGEQPKEPVSETPTPPEALWTLITALYPNAEVEFEDSQMLEDGTGFVVVMVDTEQGEVSTFWKVPFQTLEDGTYSLGEPEEVQPAASDPEQPKEPVQAKSRAVVKASEPVAIGDEPPTEIKIWSYGLVQTTKGDSVLTRENANAIVQDWATRGVDLHFDYEHGTFSDSAAAGNPAPAAGWFKLEAREDGLYAVGIKWTAKAAELIREKAYRYFSPAYEVDIVTSQIVAVANVALTNLPATKNIDALVKAKTELEATAAKQQTEILQLRREAHKTKVAASIKLLEEAGIPPAVISRGKPLLEQFDAPTLTLARNGKTEQITAAEILQSTLLEMAKIGVIPKGEITSSQGEKPTITLENAILEQQKNKPSMRYKDAIIAARAAYPHLRAAN